LDNPNECEDDCVADDKSDIEYDNRIEDAGIPSAVGCEEHAKYSWIDSANMEVKETG